MNFEAGVDVEPDADIEMIRGGDRDALARFAQRHRDRFLATIIRISSDRLRQVVDPEDLLQEAVTGALASLDQVASPQLDPMLWLLGCLRRRVVDAHRYHFSSRRRDAARHQSMDRDSAGDGWGLIDILSDSLTTPSAAFSRNVKVERVRAAIMQLEPEKRDVVRWRYVEGLPTKEIASRIGKTDAAVRVMLTRTMRTLESMLQE